MKIKGLKVFVLNEADRSDPTNQLTIVGAKAIVDGQDCAWRGAAVAHNGDYQAALNLATAHLIKQILTKPRNGVNLMLVPISPEVQFEVPDVLIAEYDIEQKAG